MNQHEERAETRSPGGERSADCEPLAKVMQSDPKRNVVASANPVGAPADARRPREMQNSCRCQEDHDRPLEGGSFFSEFQRIFEVEKQEREKPDGERQGSSCPAD